MSTTTDKRPLATALADAFAFRDMFDGCYSRWEIAGSVRRKRQEVGDIEHVVTPATGEIEEIGGLFPIRKTVNLLWHRIDALVAAGTISKHIYGATGFRWGEKYRGVDFRGCNHEIFTANDRNLGIILAIRTGPAEFSERLVTVLKRNGTPCSEGYVRDGAGMIVDTPDEHSAFRMAGLSYIEPENRR